MMNDYPAIMENELIYMYILRYHRFCGNTSAKRTFKEFLDGNRGFLNIHYQGSVKYFLKYIGVDADTYFERHSLWPFYRMFLPEAVYEKCKRKMLNRDKYSGGSMWRYYSYDADSFIKRALWYCPICHKEKMDFTDIKLSHQIPGVYSCEKHHCRLKFILERYVGHASKPENWDVSYEPCKDEWLNGIAEDVSYIMEHCPCIYREGISILVGNELDKQIKEHSKETVEAKLLERYKELPTEYQDYSRRLMLNRYRVCNFANPNITPMEYMILIRMLFGSFEEFAENHLSILEKY